MRILLIVGVIVLVLLGVVLLSPTHGNETCIGCREERAIMERFWWPVVEGSTPNACSEWIAANVPEHRHSWRRTGCWDSARENVCLPTPAQLGAPADDWLGYLQSLPDAERLATIDAMVDEAQVLSVVEALDAWRAGR